LEKSSLGDELRRIDAVSLIGCPVRGEELGDLRETWELLTGELGKAQRTTKRFRRSKKKKGGE